jgi:hypothetical protein
MYKVIAQCCGGSFYQEVDTWKEATSMVMELMEEIVDGEWTWRNVRVIDNSNKEGGTL